MTYKATILNISVAIFLVGILIYCVLNYGVLSEGEGWGVVYMVGLAGVGLVAGLADLILQVVLRNRTAINIIGLLIVIGLSTSIYIG